MQIKTLTGHLTAREKQVIIHMIQNDLDAAKSARITFRLSVEGDIHTVVTSRNERDDWGRMKERNHSATFTVREVRSV